MVGRGALAVLALIASGCAPSLPRDTPSRAAAFDVPQVPINRFAAARPTPPFKRNEEIARDFLDLSFRLESGRSLPALSRFEGPVSVRVTGRPTEALHQDLDALLRRLRGEAGVDIRRARTPDDANITIEAVSRSDIRKLLPQAACFVVPNVSSLAEYRRARRTSAVNWLNVTERRRVAIIVPFDAAPQEIRDCLHEEVAQALGPLNDLYRLTDSVFNDDNMHTVLTGFDMLVLRVTYDPALSAGMGRDEVARRLPSLLARHHPQGLRTGTRFDPVTPPRWADAVQTALGPGTRPAMRARAAQAAVDLARKEGWQDHRRGFSLYLQGRILQVTDPTAARAAFEAADQALREARGTALHRAHVAAQLAAYALAERDAEAVLALVRPAEAVALQHENAALLAMLMHLRAEALMISGRASEARAVRMDSLGWARYGFGAEQDLRAQQRAVARITP